MNINQLPCKLRNYLRQSNEKVLVDRFTNIKNPSDKVEFCINIFHDQHLQDVFKCESSVKDEEATESAFIQAMVELQGNNLENALILLNKSLCHAPEKSKNLAKIYANRAKIYFNMKLYEPCLQNIDLATINGALNDPQLEVEKVRTKCMNILINGTDITKQVDYDLNDCRLSYSAHSNIPYIADCIQLNMDKVYGRHLITNRDLKPGDVIMMEEPFAPVIDTKSIYKKCAYCLSFNFYNLIPCSECASAMFCSRECYQSAAEKFHKYECRFMHQLHEWFNGESLIALKLLLLAIHAFPDLNDLKNLAAAVNATSENQFSYNFADLSNFTLFKTICSLTTVENDRNHEDLFRKAQIAAILYEMLMQHEDLQQRTHHNGHGSFMKELLYHFVQTATINTFPMWSLPEITARHAKTEEVSDFGIAAYPLSSFLSHSCAPNVRKARAGIDNEIMLIFVIRPIRKGEKICDCYDQQNNHINRSLEERRAILYDQYYFMCQCEACIHDYSTKENLQHKLKPLEWEQIKATIQHADDSVSRNQSTMEHADKQSEFMKRHEQLCTFLQDYDHYYPSHEIIQAQECLHQNIRKLYTKPQFVYDSCSSA